MNATVDGAAHVAGAVLSIRDGTGNVVWQLDVSLIGAVSVSRCTSVILDALFLTDIRTLITAGAGHMTVAYQ